MMGRSNSAAWWLQLTVDGVAVAFGELPNNRMMGQNASKGGVEKDPTNHHCLFYRSIFLSIPTFSPLQTE